MAIEEYTPMIAGNDGREDQFEFESNDFAFSFPCCCCAFRHSEPETEEPCAKCKHYAR